MRTNLGRIKRPNSLGRIKRPNSRGTKAMDDRRARKPGVSLCELVLNGLLGETDFEVGGKVNEAARTRAEQMFYSMNPVREEVRTPRRSPRPVFTPPRSFLSRPPRPPRPVPPPPILSEMQQSLGQKSCCICKTKEKTHAPFPCFHMCMCEGCSELVDKCPLCRSEIVSVHKIFL